jgi:UDP-N-acetylglucosamine acyltransferase
MVKSKRKSKSMGINNIIHPTAIIYPCVELGDNNYIGAYTVLGSPPEHSRHLDSNYKVIIGNNNRITEYVTINQGAENDTIIGDSNFFLRGSHIGHDTKIGNNNTFSCNALVGGYSIIDNNVNMGLGSICHQYSYIPNGTMLGMGTILTKQKIEEYSIYVGNPAKFLKINTRTFVQK